MHRAATVLLAVALIAATPAPNATPPPLIYHVITRPLCSKMRTYIKPAIGMMLQNDAQIKKGPDLFNRYNRGALTGTDNSASNGAGDPGGVAMTGESGNGTMNESQNMALLGMENLVSPIANNIIAVQKMLDDPALAATGNADDDKRLQAIRAKLLRALATQSAALDIINGFVDTQAMGNLQHAGQEYISAVTQSDTRGTQSAVPTPFPLEANPNQAGLPQNPYSIDLANVPGLTLGYNPVTRLVDALHWTMDQTATRENEAAKDVMDSAALCANGTPSAPNPH